MGTYEPGYDPEYCEDTEPCRHLDLDLPPEVDDETGRKLNYPFSVKCPDCGERVTVRRP